MSRAMKSGILRQLDSRVRTVRWARSALNQSFQCSGKYDFLPAQIGPYVSISRSKKSAQKLSEDGLNTGGWGQFVRLV